MSSPPVPDSREVDVGDGGTLRVTRAGQGTPLVLLHGFTGSGESWRSLRDQLAGRVETITVDLPGHGHSRVPHQPARHALPRVADDVVRVLDVLGLERVAFLGYSMGGRLALHVALRHPDRLLALVLESTSPGIAEASERLARRASDEDLALRLERDGITAFVDAWERLPLWAGQRLTNDAQADLRRRRLANDPAGLAASLRGAGAAAHEPLHGRLREIAMPTLVVAGARDERYAAIGRAMAQGMPAARLSIVGGAGHAAHLERPGALAALVLQHLDVQ